LRHELLKRRSALINGKFPLRSLTASWTSRTKSKS